jgi:hypothetical protein
MLHVAFPKIKPGLTAGSPWLQPKMGSLKEAPRRVNDNGRRRFDPTYLRRQKDSSSRASLGQRFFPRFDRLTLSVTPHSIGPCLMSAFAGIRSEKQRPGSMPATEVE